MTGGVGRTMREQTSHRLLVLVSLRLIHVFLLLVFVLTLLLTLAIADPDANDMRFTHDGGGKRSTRGRRSPSVKLSHLRLPEQPKRSAYGWKMPPSALQGCNGISTLHPLDPYQIH